MKTTLSDIIKALYSEKETPTRTKQKTDTTMYGKVVGVNDTNKTYDVQIAGGTVTCDRMVGAEMGDTVMVLVQKTGHPTVINTVGGDKDALNAEAEADSINQHFWYRDGRGSEAGAHVTEVPQEDFETTPQGGNVLIKTLGMYIRIATTTLASFLSDGLRIFEPNDSVNPIAQFLSTGAIIGKPTAVHWVFDSNGLKLFRPDDDIPNFLISPIEGVDGLGVDFLSAVQDAFGEYTNYTDMRLRARQGLSEFEITTQGTSDTTPQEIGIAEFQMGRGYVKIGAYAYNQPNFPPYVNFTSGELEYKGNPFFKTFTASAKKTVDADKNATFNCRGTVPSGYTPIAIQSVDTGHPKAGKITSFTLKSNGVDVTVHNEGGQMSYTVSCTILCTSVNYGV